MFSHAAMRKNPALLFLSAVFLACLLASCGPQPEEKHYPIQAEVIAVDLPKRLIIVKHGDIPGLMPAMTMSYVIAIPKEAERLGPGDKISADLVVSESKAHLEKILLLEKAKSTPTLTAPPTTP
jgi:Cu/Ag efflux protein CusF